MGGLRNLSVIDFSEPGVKKKKNLCSHGNPSPRLPRGGESTKEVPRSKGDESTSVRCVAFLKSGLIPIN